MTKVAVVTGANKGIGYAIVESLCQKFDGTVILAARDAQRGETAVKSLQEKGLNPKFYQLDVDNKVSIKQFHDRVKQDFGGIDILVNNAAIAYKNDATEPFAEQAENTIRVNFTGLVNVCETLFPLLRPHARVVNVSSSVGHLTRIPGEQLRERFRDPELTKEKLEKLMAEFVESAKQGDSKQKGWGTSAYSASKVGVTALTVLQQKELDAARPGQDIVVNAVHPGYVDTDMTSHKGPLSPDQGAEAPVYAALLPPSVVAPRGGYIWSDSQQVDWIIIGPTPPDRTN